MKKTAVFCAIAMAMSANAFAQELKVEVLGEAAVGFEYNHQAEGAKDISKLDMGFALEFGNVYGMVFAESGTMTSEGYGHGVDGYGVIPNRVYAGYKFSDAVRLQLGSQDSALDLVKDFGNKTVELSHNVTTVEDVKMGIAAYGQLGAVEYGVSVNDKNSGATDFQAGWNDHSAVSGYAKLNLTETLTFVGGAEYRLADGTDSLAVMAGIDFGMIGANVFHDTNTESTGGTISLGQNLTENFYLAGGYNFETGNGADVSYINIGAALDKNLGAKTALKADVKFDMADSEAHTVWVRQFVYF